MDGGAKDKRDYTDYENIKNTRNNIETSIKLPSVRK